MKPDYAILAHNIKLLRNKNNLTQAEFAKLHKISPKTFGNYETGLALPKAAFLLSVSRAEGIEPEFITGTKIKMDRNGKITNIPSRDKELQSIKDELHKLTATFQTHYEQFVSGLNTINTRLNRLEKQRK